MGYNVDLQKIADNIGFDLEDVEMVFEAFLDGAKEHLETLEKAVEADNFDDIVHSAHSIKGSALNLSLENIAEIAKEMELKARAKEDIAYKEKLELLKELISKLTD